MSNQDIALEIKDLMLTFGGVNAIDGVNLSFPKGQISAIVGPNGAGKTSLFNVISGLLMPTSGTVRLNGKNVTGKSSKTLAKSGLSRTFQIPAIFPHLTVRENVQASIVSYYHNELNFISYVKGFHREETNQLVRAIGLYEERNRMVSELSYGDRKILDVGMALARDPQLLLLDEPTQGIDVMEAERVVSVIEEFISNKNMTVLFTEHDMNSVRSIAHRVVVMRQGKVALDGDPRTIIESEEMKEIYFKNH